MRSEKELNNVITALNSQRRRLPEFSFSGKSNYHIIDSELFYINYYIKIGCLPRFVHSKDVLDCYNWLQGNEDNGYYEDILIELVSPSEISSNN